MEMKMWDKKEEEFLKRSYNDYKTEDLAKKLNRSFHSVKHKLDRLNINKGFKFCKGCPVKWGEKEKTILLRYKDKSIRRISRILKKTEPQIRYALRKFKIERQDP